MPMPFASAPLARGDAALALTAGALSLAAFLATLSPTVHVVGSGELIAAVHTAGIAHPPGYPLFVLAGRVVSLLTPWLSVPMRVNFFTALCGAWACALVYLCGRTLALPRPAALAGALWLAWSGTFWSQAVTAEVYTLHVALMAATLLLAARWFCGDGRAFFGLTYVMGLGLAHHLTVVLIWPALAWVLWLKRSWVRERPRWLAWGIGLGLVGLSPYLSLWVRAELGPAIQWVPLRTMGDFWDHITAQEYRHLLGQLPLGAIGHNLGRFAAILVEQGTLLALPFVVLGLIESFHLARPLAGPLVMIAAVNLLYAVNYDITDIHVFYMPTFLVTALWIGFGLAGVGRRLGAWRRVAVARGWGWALAFVLPAVPLAANWQAVDLHDNWLAYRYGLDILGPLPRGAALLAEGDDATFILCYLHLIEGRRPDVQLSCRGGHFSPGVYGKDLARLQKAPRARRMALTEERLLRRGRPVFDLRGENQWGIPGYRWEPYGLTYRIVPDADSADSGDLAAQWRLSDPDSFIAAGWGQDLWLDRILAHYTFARAEALYSRGAKAAADSAYARVANVAAGAVSVQYNLGRTHLLHGDLDRSAAAFERALEIDPFFVQALYGRGEVALEQGRREEALAWYMRSVRSDPAFASGYNALGVAYAQMGDLIRAREYWRKAVEVAPGHVNARQNLQRLRRHMRP